MMLRGGGVSGLAAGGGGEGEDHGLVPPGGRHQLADRPADGPPAVHHLAVQPDGVPHLAAGRHLVRETRKASD